MKSCNLISSKETNCTVSCCRVRATCLLNQIDPAITSSLMQQFLLKKKEKHRPCALMSCFWQTGCTTSAFCSIKLHLLTLCRCKLHIHDYAQEPHFYLQKYKSHLIGDYFKNTWKSTVLTVSVSAFPNKAVNCENATYRQMSAALKRV